MNEKPLLLLDVDGVLRPLGGSNASASFTIEGADFETIEFDPQLPGWLADLSQHFELTWATLWEDDANLHLAPAWGLPPLRWVCFSGELRAEPGISEKLAPVRRFVGDRPFAWTDDQVADDMLEWCDAHSAPSLVLEIDPVSGLQHNHVRELLAFAATIGSQ